ncbi:MAG: hypothetical protein JO176_16255 [Acidimicrobiia bacterium]|nr:hypothetical protein [Acidimicrobiia bacterium]MBV9286175.1 hypothetical protein [Acidimicrobiia bacterium]
MDVATVDNEYQQLQQEAQQVSSAISDLATKLQAASQAGDANAKEWLLDLKSVALQIQAEQLQTQSLLQALHDFAVNTIQTPQAPAPAAAPMQAAPAQPEGGGMLSHFRGSGFGQAMVQGAGMGAGFGLMDSVINSIFN